MYVRMLEEYSIILLWTAMEHGIGKETVEH